MTILGIHIFSCWFMTGLIWTVQLLVYPFFRSVGEKEFSRLHQFHMRQISWIVVPVMCVELISAIALYLMKPSSLFFWNAASVGFIWILTALVNVPTHNQLNFQSEESKIKLVRRNWARTIAWTLRSLFFLTMTNGWGQLLS